MKIIYLIAIILFPTLAWAQFYSDTTEYTFALPEITQDPEDERCALYTNRFQTPSGDEEVWDSPVGPVTFKFFRGEAEAPDQVMVWDVPEGYVVLPNTITLDEYEQDYFCLVEYTGS